MSTNPLLTRAAFAFRAVLVLAILTLLAIALRSLLTSREAVLRMRATIAAQDQLIQEAEARQREREEILVKRIAEIEVEKRAVRTPTQAAAKILQILPPLPAPIRIDFPRPNSPVRNPHSIDSDISAPVTSQLAADLEPPALVTIPQPDLKPLHDYLQDCRACQLQLTAAQQDLRDERTKTAALTTQRDSAVRAAQGGGFWSRVRSASKWLVVGGILGAMAASSR